MAGARGLNIRTAVQCDAFAITAIYAHHVAHGTATFDTEPPSETHWAEKISDITGCGWPFLVATRDDCVIGYAYATQFRDRPAYAHSCEDSIYIDPTTIGQGVGTTLMAALLDAAAKSGFTQMIAVIGGGEPASIALHTKAGFRHAGRMEKVGLKFGRILDTVYMQRGLGKE
jgi:L-amino acid N-acyltransferase YncA